MNIAGAGIGAFILVIIVNWIVFSIIIWCAKPNFFNESGNLDLWTTFWVSLLLAIFSSIVLALLGWGLYGSYQNNNCQPQCQPQPQQCIKCVPTTVNM
jgi:hypothetical protein